MKWKRRGLTKYRSNGLGCGPQRQGSKSPSKKPTSSILDRLHVLFLFLLICESTSLIGWLTTGEDMTSQLRFRRRPNFYVRLTNASRAVHNYSAEISAGLLRLTHACVLPAVSRKGSPFDSPKQGRPLRPPARLSSCFFVQGRLQNPTGIFRHSAAPGLFVLYWTCRDPRRKAARPPATAAPRPMPSPKPSGGRSGRAPAAAGSASGGRRDAIMRTPTTPSALAAGVGAWPA